MEHHEHHEEHKEKIGFQLLDTGNLGNKWDKLEILVGKKNILWTESVKPVGVTHMIVILKSWTVSFIENTEKTKGVTDDIIYDRYYLL